MRIYEIEVEHKKWGLNWRRFKIASRGFLSAMRTAKARLHSGEVISEIKLHAYTHE